MFGWFASISSSDKSRISLGPTSIMFVHGPLDSSAFLRLRLRPFLIIITAPTVHMLMHFKLEIVITIRIKIIMNVCNLQFSLKLVMDWCWPDNNFTNSFQIYLNSTALYFRIELITLIEMIVGLEAIVNYWWFMTDSVRKRRRRKKRREKRRIVS